MHYDGGANSHIFKDKRHFWKYAAIKSTVKQVTGDEAPVQGMGIVLVKMKYSKGILVLYLCYHMPNNPQLTFGLPALKYNGEMRSVRIEILSCIRLVDKHRKKSFQTIIPYYHKAQLMDYIPIAILQYDQNHMKQSSTTMYRMTHTHMLTDLLTEQQQKVHQ